MASVVIDTDVFSFAFKQDTRAAVYWPHLAGKNLNVSFSTVAELFRWATKNRWGSRRIAELRSALQHYTVLVYEEQMAWRWAEVMSIPGVPVGHGTRGWRLRRFATESRWSRITARISNAFPD